MDDILGYAGRRAVVTGAASGMGEATARLLTELGAEVVALDVKTPSVPGVQAVPVDLRDPASIDQAVAQVAEPVHSVCNCAGLPGPPFSDLDTMLVNFVGARHLLEQLVAKMPEGSAIAYVASAAGMGWRQHLATIKELLETEGFDAGRAWCEAHPADIAGGYAFSKEVINAWTAWRAHSLMQQHRIRLNCTNPGPTQTAMMQSFHDAVGKVLVDAAQGAIGRYATAEEQAWPLVMLNSPRMSYVSGECFYTDGGFSGALEVGLIDFAALLAGG